MKLRKGSMLVLFVSSILLLNNIFGAAIDASSEEQKRDTELSHHLPPIQKNCDEWNQGCPLWTERINNTCKCKKSLERIKSVKCDSKTLQLSIIKCSCVTLDNDTCVMHAGNCIENCENGYKNSQFLPLPLKVSKLNQFMCEERWNRTGRLCGKCLPGHSPLAYSYDMRCVKCPEGNRNIWKYILIAFGPTTIFYFLILLLRIKATSLHLHSYIIFCQVISLPDFLRALSNYVRFYNPNSRALFYVYYTFIAVWNLDFFRSFDLGICLNLPYLTVLALDYAVAIYPLLLTVVSYFLIELHDRNYRVLVVLWKPFYYISTRFRRNWDSRTTIIDAYTTFYILSFVKMTCISADLLIPVRAYSLNNDSVTWVLYYDGTVDYFGKEHLPYALTAIVCMLMFSVTPILLLLFYQLKCFQKLLGCLNARSQLLQAMMDSFQGCFKNGLEPGTRDYRWFAAVPFIGQIAMLFVVAALLNSSSFPLLVIIINCITFATAIIQPYKTHLSKQTKNEIAFWVVMGILFCIEDTVMYERLKSSTLIKVGHILRLVVAMIPLLYITYMCIYWILSRAKKAKKLVSRIKAWKKGYSNMENEIDSILPDRVINPEHYES